MRLALSILIIVSLPCLTMAKPKIEPVAKGKDWNGPFIGLKVNPSFARYMQKYDKLEAKKSKIAEIDKDAKRKKKEADWKEDFEKLQEGLEKKVKSESKVFERELDRLEKQIDGYLAKRDKGGTKTAMAKLDMLEDAARKRRRELNGAVGATSAFMKYCTGNANERKGTPFGLVGMMPPPTKAKDANDEAFDLGDVQEDYKILVFFSVNNRDSMSAMRDIGRMDGKKVSGKKIKVVFINVDKDEKDAKKRDLFIKKSLAKKTVLIDKTKALCALYRVGYLPHAVLVDGDDIVRQVVIDPKARMAIDAKIKAIAKEDAE
jgi:hypothetical protein